MDQNLDTQWQALHRAYTTAQAEVDASTRDIAERARQKACGGLNLLQCFDARDRAAEKWLGAKQALAAFCRVHRGFAFPGGRA